MTRFLKTKPNRIEFNKLNWTNLSTRNAPRQIIFNVSNSKGNETFPRNEHHERHHMLEDTAFAQYFRTEMAAGVNTIITPASQMLSPFDFGHYISTRRSSETTMVLITRSDLMTFTKITWICVESGPSEVSCDHTGYKICGIHPQRRSRQYNHSSASLHEKIVETYLAWVHRQDRISTPETTKTEAFQLTTVLEHSGETILANENDYKENTFRRYLPLLN